MRHNPLRTKYILALAKNNMDIQHKDGQHRGKFFIEEGGEQVAEIVYSHGAGNTIVIEHTGVDEELQGRNIGFELVQKTVEYARAHGLKISPVCPFAKAVFDKEPGFKDVLV